MSLRNCMWVALEGCLLCLCLEADYPVASPHIDLQRPTDACPPHPPAHSEMRKNGIQPCAMVIATLIDACTREMIQVCTMNACTEQGHDNKSKKADWGVLSALPLSALRHGKGPQDAACAHGARLSGRPGTPATSCVVGTSIDRADIVLQQVFADGISAKVVPDLPLWNALINAAGRAGQLDRAFQALDDMQVGDDRVHHESRQKLLACMAQTHNRRSNVCGIPVRILLAASGCHGKWGDF